MVTNTRILIIRLSSIGDVLHTTPVARALKQALPSCHLTWVAGQVSAELLHTNPDLDEVYIWPRERFEQAFFSGKLNEAWQLWQQLKTDLAARHFDIALDIQGLFLTGMIAVASNAPRRIGLANTKEMNKFFMTEIAPPPLGKHVIERYLTILRPLGISAANSQMTLKLPADAIHFAEKILKDYNITNTQPLIAMVPSTTWPAKNWPADYFARTAQILSKDYRLLMCGGPGDRSLASYIIAKADVPIINMAGKTSLMEMAALLAKCQLLLVGDTGPLHMAVALDIPTVSIFGATDPQRFGPLTAGHIVLQSYPNCAPCHKRVCRHTTHCLEAVTPELAVKAIRRLLDASTTTSGLGPPVQIKVPAP